MHRVPDGKLLPERIDAFVALCGCRLLKQFADLPRLDFWRQVPDVALPDFPTPTLPYVLSMGCAVQSGRNHSVLGRRQRQGRAHFPRRGLLRALGHTSARRLPHQLRQPSVPWENAKIPNMADPNPNGARLNC